MAGIYRKFGNVRYPVPDVLTAIEKIVGPDFHWEFDHDTKTFDVWEHPEGKLPPSWEEVEEELLKEVKIYNYYLYERTREKEYPEMKEQLDMLYHDIENQNLSNGEWITKMREVRNNIPKPDEPQPENY